MFGAEGLMGILLWILVLVLSPLLIPLAFVTKIVLRRPWWVEAKSPGQIMRWRVRGWSESGRVVEDVAKALEAGVREPSPSGAERVQYWGPKAMLEQPRN